ncbi:alpha/beta hydrolase family protein [Paradesertivirga mongoliensis]
MLLSIISTHGQDITGRWNGALKFGASQLRIVFNINKTGAGFTSTMDSPDQGARGIPVTTTTFEDSKLRLEIVSAQIEYNGVLSGNILKGTFKQAGHEFPLELSKGELQANKRPQDPIMPYSYHSEEIIFKNTKANISLAGTLTLPRKEGNYPAVILISGSGPQNRDEELFGHKPFLVIADHLTKNGIAVLRYDDRGFAKSQGDFQKATIADFISDVESAVAYLKTRKEIDKQKIGLIGHSEGGIIAPQVAVKSPDVNFIVLLAGPGMRGSDLMLLQKERIEQQMGIPETAILQSQKLFKGAYEIILKSSVNDSTLSTKISAYFKTQLGNQVPENQINDITRQLVNPWMVGLLRYDPIPVLKKVKIPVLALNGEKDLQVPAQENLAGIKNALAVGGNEKVTIKEYATLNHLFQQCRTCLTTEYGEIEETFSPAVLNEMTRWIISQTNKN